MLGVPIQSLGEIGAKNFQENNVSFEHYHVIPGLGPSDSALKENLKPIQGAVERIQLIAGYTFTWKQDSTNTQDIGVIAQEVEVVFPEAVTENPEQGTKLVYYYKLVPVLIEAIKEQQEVIEEQQKEIDRLIESVEDLQIERN